MIAFGIYSSGGFSQFQRIMYSINHVFKQFPQRLLSNILKGSNYTTHASHLKLSPPEIQSAKNYCANLLRYNLGPNNPHPSQLTPLPSSIENTTPLLTRSKPSSRGMLSLPTSPSARSTSNSPWSPTRSQRRKSERSGSNSGVTRCSPRWPYSPPRTQFLSSSRMPFAMGHPSPAPGYYG